MFPPSCRAHIYPSPLPHRSHPLQKSTVSTFSEEAFALLVAEIGQDYRSELKYEPDAVLALQAAAEDYLVELFEARDFFAFYAISHHTATLRSHTSIRPRALNAFTQVERF